MPDNNYNTSSDKLLASLQNISSASISIKEKIESVVISQEKLRSINNKVGNSFSALSNNMNIVRQEREIIIPVNFNNLERCDNELKKLEERDNITKKVDIKADLAPIKTEAIIKKVETVSNVVAAIAKPAIGFNQSMADLSAITGITGKDLKELGNIAKKTGADSGIGATQSVEAFKQLASQIDVSKIGINGLKELQAKSVTLAQASGMAINDSADAVAGTITQFGLSANEANRVINVLTAGSKYGAAEIPELTQSLKVAGAAAVEAGLSVESTAGAIEILSKNNLKGAEAGYALSDIILKMQSDLGVNFGETSLSKALDDLKPKLNDTAYLSNVFGTENVATAKFLIQNSEAVQEMTERVTNSNTAQEQASIRTDTWQTKMDKLRAKIDNMKIALIENTGDFGVWGTIIGENAATISQIFELTNTLGGAFKGLSSILTGSIPFIDDMAGKLKNCSISTKLMTGAQWLLNAAMAVNPIVWIVVGVTALIAGIVLLWNKCEGFRKVIFGVWGVIKEFGSTLFNAVLEPVKNIISGLGSLGTAIWKLFKGDFKGAAKEAKDGAKKLFENNPISVGMNVVAKVAGADYGSAYKKESLRGINGAKDNSSMMTQIGTVPITSATPLELPEKDKLKYSTNNMNPIAESGMNNRNTRVERICNDIIINIQDLGDKSIQQVKDIILDTLETALA